MSNSDQEKMTQAIQEQQAHWISLASKAMENSMKLFELNMRMAKESFLDSSQSVQQLLAGKGPEEVFAPDAEKMQLKLNRMMSYAKEVNEITAGFNAELGYMTREQFYEAFLNGNNLAGNKPDIHDKNQLPLDFMMHGYEQWIEAGKKLAGTMEHALVTPKETPRARETSVKNRRTKKPANVKVTPRK